MQWGQNTTHTVPGPDDYDRSYGNGQPVRTMVYQVMSRSNLVFNQLVPQNTTILEIILEIDKNFSHPSQSILANDEYAQYTGDYRLNNGFILTDMDGNCLNADLNTPVENIVTLGQQRQRQAIFKIVYGSGWGCSMMGGKKSYKKSYNNKKRKSRKSRKSRRHRRK